ncbi:MAG TPA: PAS domain-containing sensor histidine kinase [Sphingomonas bacterium]|jgi:two-component system nitrogen regulation sensor histidine kinase NtrY|uniref:histidine kinase n=1 Tax=Sphingomonas bacterium TaxID=1895847 RepID=A0A3D0WC42_9SPHN|nr:PAS domain-containing sensor histidine kinase [Sphingomonas bacterium]
MEAVAVPDVLNTEPRKRLSVTPLVELGVLGLAVAIGVATYFTITADPTSPRPLTPPLVALLMVANLVPAVALLVLIGRRIAIKRAMATAAGGQGRLHVRLVALFSVLASVPMILVTIVASMLFQYGVEFWYSDRAKDMIERAATLANESYVEMTRWVDGENVAVGKDVANLLSSGYGFDTTEFVGTYAQSVLQRSLAESIIFGVSPKGEILTFALLDPYERGLASSIRVADARAVLAGKPSVVIVSGERVQSIAPVPGTQYLVASSRVVGAKELMQRKQRAEGVVADYRALRERSRSLQLRFNLALLGISLFIVGLAVFAALAIADRLVRPVNDLVDAARGVAGGNFDARVSQPKRMDEVGTLASAFNTMTERLKEQTGALVAANAESESRRALIEAVMSGVSAGVVSIGAGRTVRLLNSSAANLLQVGESHAIGRPLVEVAPELDALLASDQREAVVQVARGGEPRTLAVKITREAAGPILTFDDITQQLADQRRAAWADVARRIAHEIKNPLTPIQLAAERLQRRYGKNIEPSDTTFSRLTETIVRQVGDLRRMVDEFSSFARMPKPVFRRESLVDIARQSMFLHEVGHPGIAFRLDADADAPVSLVCDRRQIGQALTNIIKNAAEAIEARPPADDLPQGEVVMALDKANGRVTLSIADNGVGLPVERDRIVEPYMTTRSRGTGLGLAIVKKIAEEHMGTIAFADRPGGGTVVTLSFDARALEPLAAPEDAEATPAPTDDDRFLMLTRTRNPNP